MQTFQAEHDWAAVCRVMGVSLTAWVCAGRDSGFPSRGWISSQGGRCAIDEHQEGVPSR